METEETAPVRDDGESNAPSIETLTAELAAAKALAEERYSELQYARADIENARKRALRNAEDRIAQSRRSLFTKFLPVLDNLQRALRFDDSRDLRGGLQATLKGFEAVLESEGVKQLETVGKPFDPRLAEAIATRESADGQDDMVLEEAQSGYRFGDDVLRPALVVVSKCLRDDME